MNIYTNITFRGFYPVGSAAIVRATTAQDAAKLLEAELEVRGLKQIIPPAEMKVFVGVDSVRILCDGNY